MPLEIRATLEKRNSHRKRMVGGFYAYENTSTSRDLGRLCSGKSDARGLLQCETEFSVSGEVSLAAIATDDAGRKARALGTVWVGADGDNWFGAGNQDRIDVLPEKKQYQPGETAVFQVRMPFREATALVAVERDGVLETSVVKLSGSAPVIRLPVKAGHAPNIYLSVLAVRGQLREVPWYSFFTWGWREPRNWLADFRAYQAPGAMVDLARPPFRFGVAEIGVGAASHQLAVKVSTAQSAFPVRSRALATVQVNLPDGRPAAGAEIALAAVDEALLELQPNESWNLLPAMLQRRSYGVQTAAAQLQVVCKRHYGRKAMPAGGGGGRALTRELVDTLLLWRPAIVLDAQGSAQVEVPLNDTLTSFRIVAMATSGAGLYGHGAAVIRTTQDVQLIAGLPPLARHGDRYSAMVTVRNGAEREMEIAVSALVDGRALESAPRRIRLASGGAGAQDALKLSQKLLPAVPVTVQQATLFQLDKSRSIALSPPAGATGPRRRGVIGSATAGRRGRRPAPLLQRLPVQLPGTEGLARGRPGRPGRLAAAYSRTANLPGPRRPGALLPVRQRRSAGQSGADRLPAGAGARGRMDAAGTGPGPHAAGPAGLCRRPHRRQRLDAAEGYRRVPAVGAGSAVALRPHAGARAGRGADRAWPVADLGAAGLDRHPAPQPRPAGPGAPARGGRP
ncbi:MAG: alpha-2-macroglobulin family protein [Noviherbaspirillum sp.]